MPKKVHTRFEDESESKFLPKNSVAKLPPKSNPTLAPGKKRKRGSSKTGVNGAAQKELGKASGTQWSDRTGFGEGGTKNKGSKTGWELTSKEHKAHMGQLSKRREALLPLRQALPIWFHADEIRKGLRGNKDVMLLVGETGSGKSTQVPQFLLHEAWCKGQIAITQPRRMAAISLARRVAEEMGTPLGSWSPASKVGYSVRFDTSISSSTRIKFLTEGMLLQEMLHDPSLRQYSAVIVDEVHERSVNVDLVLGFLRNLVTRDKKKRKGAPLKVVIMSATADIAALFNFFNEGFEQVSTPQKEPEAQNKQESSYDSESSWSGISDDESSKATGEPVANGRANSSSTGKNVSVSANEPSKAENGHQSQNITTCHIEGRQYPVKIHYLSEPTQDFVETALKSIFQVHHKEPLPGDILVFLTGQDTVESLEKLVNEYAQGLDPSVPKILTLPLFAALPQTAQQKIFQPAPPRTRKVIIATNIAETSVTVPGVRFVVDSGKVKIKQFRNRLGLDSLLVKDISRSAAIQRAGRAGREAPGTCHRLYTEETYREFQPATTPEILRCDLSSALLTMKARGIDDVIGFPLLNRPPRESLEKALLQLFQLGALDDAGKISDFGSKIAKYPLIPSLGRILIEAAGPERDCLLEIIDIIACLSVETIFLNLVSDEKKEEAEEARRELFRREGDHLTFLATVQQYAAEQTDRKAWAEKHFVSHRAMQNVMDIRKQLRNLCMITSLFTHTFDWTQVLSNPSEQTKSSILQSLLRGFAANTARLMPDGSYRTILGNQTVAIHPSSVLFGRKVEAILFSEFVFTNKSYARGVSAVRLDWVGEVLGA